MRTRLPRPARAYLAAVSATGLVVLGWLLVHGRGLSVGRDEPALWLLAAFTVLNELRPIPAPLGRGSIDVTVSTTFAFALLLLSGPAEAALTLTAATIVADAVARKRWWKSAFNVAQYSLSVAAAGAVVGHLATRYRPGTPLAFDGAEGLVAVAAGAAAFSVTNVVVIGLAVVLLERLPVASFLRHDFGAELVANAALLILSPVVAIVAQHDAVLLPVFLVPVALAHKSAAVSAQKDHQALHDALTGLPNRVLFRDRTSQAVAAAARSGGRMALLLVDLDRFKEVNDTLGHHTGDQLLRRVGGRLREALRDSDTVARLGGDEFGVVLREVTDEAAAALAADRVLRALQVPVELDGLALEVGGSVGVALFPDHGTDADTLIQRADVAMYVAKSAATGRAVYTFAHDQNSPMRLALAGELRRAIDDRQLRVHYQPKVSLATGRACGAEALVRWEHPTRGLVPPDDFIPVAEQTGLIRNLTEVVLAEALRQCRTWERQGRDLRVAVNVSARVLHDTGFPDLVARLLDESGVEAAKLELEITESMIMADPVRSLGVLGELGRLGVELAVDDYGTGHSTLAYLKRLPVTELKIDKSFIVALAEDDSDAVIVGSTIDLGRRLGLRVVAEGVETAEAYERLVAMGCDLAQGYYLSPPLPPEGLEAWAEHFGTKEEVRRAVALASLGGKSAG